MREPGEGEVLVSSCLSRSTRRCGWMNAGRSYVAPVKIGAVMRALGAGRVVASRNPGFAVGDHVTGVFGVQEYAISNGQGLMKVDVRSGAAAGLR